jgi:hypothetical protein
MIAAIVAGILVLVIGLWLLHRFVEADPARLAQGLGRLGLSAGMVLGGAVVIAVMAIGQILPAFILLAAMSAFYARQRRRRLAAGPPPGKVSEVTTDFLRMRLDHDSGTMAGTVRRGHYQGARLDELSPADLTALWRECRAEDEQAASLLEAYLDRLMPGWREAAAPGAGAAAGPSDAMTPEEAYAVLDLAPGADEAAIREAHRRLMMKLHPDHGGSTYLAAKLNRAREVLLGG